MVLVNLTDLRNQFVDKPDIATIIEALHQTNEVVNDMSVMEANGVTSHTGVLRSQLPAPSWRAINEGVVPDKAGTVQIRDVMGELASIIKIDRALLDIAPDRERFLQEQLSAHLEGFAQQVASDIFYSDTTSNPRAILGLAPRYNTLSTSAPISDYVLDAGGTGSDLRSLWIINWDTIGVTGIYPKGSTAGIQREPFNSDELLDSNGNSYMGYKLWLSWKWGLHVADFRYAVRIANIDPTTFGTSTAPDLPRLVNEAYDRMRKPSGSRLYGSASVISELKRQYADKLSQSSLLFEDINGVRYQMTPEGFPIKRVDALNTSEAQVS